MKKFQLKDYADLFGNQLPIGKVKDSTVRKEIVLLASSLMKPAREVDDELSQIKAKLTEGHEAEIDKWLELNEKLTQSKDEAEHKELLEKIEGCKEAIRINDEYGKAVTEILNEDVPEFPVRKVSLNTIVDALGDSGMLIPEVSFNTIIAEFGPIVKEEPI